MCVSLSNLKLERLSLSLTVYFVTCQEILLKGILQIIEANMNMEPLHFLTFPIILGASTPGVVSSSSRPNGAAGGKSVGLLWKGKLSPGRREGDIEYQPSHLRSSPWHIAPLHLPLVGQNCWPHMASGFSASMWLRVTEQEEKDGDKDEGEPQILHQITWYFISLYKSINMNWFWDSLVIVFQKGVNLLHLSPTMAPLSLGWD